MASYYVDEGACASGEHTVHDRSRCPPSCFAPERQTAYLGDFLDAAQAVCVARLRYPQAQVCPWCGGEDAAPPPWVGMPEPAPYCVPAQP
jgi:hypothetical protein